jgi:hypothetical protein
MAVTPYGKPDMGNVFPEGACFVCAARGVRAIARQRGLTNPVSEVPADFPYADRR